MGFLTGNLLFKSKASRDKDRLTEQKKEMIEGVGELEETTVKEIMIPRIDTQFISIDISKEELIKLIQEHGYSRYPVYKETIDNVVGILYIKDLLKTILNNQPLEIAKLVKKAYFVPESKKIDSLLYEFKRRRVHIAVAVDEYGGVSGIVCMEDVIEEIVGDIQDEFDNENEEFQTISPDVYLCDARINIDELNQKLNLELPIDDFDTLGGFVFDLLGKIPVKYEKVRWNNLDFIVQEMDNHKIKTIKIINNQKGKGDET